MVDEVTWQLFQHSVGHFVVNWRCIVLQEVYDVSHLVAALLLNTIVEASITQELNPLPELFLIIPERYVCLIRAKLFIEIFGHGYGLASGIEYNTIPSLDREFSMIQYPLVLLADVQKDPSSLSSRTSSSNH